MQAVRQRGRARDLLGGLRGEAMHLQELCVQRARRALQTPHRRAGGVRAEKGDEVRNPALWLSLPSARLAAQRPRQRVKGVPAGGNRRKAIRRVSVAMRKRLAEYQRVRVEYLRAHLTCEGCVPLPRSKHPAPATELHHTRGRVGKLLCQSENFKALCAGCHAFCHNHPAIARSAGLICPVGQWNSAPTS